MAPFFNNLLTASFHGSVVILAVIVFRLFLKNTPKKFFCLLWLLAGIRLLMPFEIRSELSLQPEPEPIVQQMVQHEIPDFFPESPLAPVTPEFTPAAEQDTPVITDAPAVADTVSVPESVTTPVSAQKTDWMDLLPWIWVAVASLFLIYTLISYLKLRFMVREAIKIEGGWECDRIETAFILGFIRPQIYIPMGLSPMVRRHILAHERTHLEKGDHWFKMIGFIALALHWFNPLVWVAYILLCKDIEMACDERVVQFMALNERKEYSAALLNCSTNHAHFAACPVAFGEVSVKHRIKSVLKYKKPGFWISLAGVIAIIFVAVCLVTSPTNEQINSVQTEAGETIVVSNVDELLAAIAPDTEIYLNPGTYNLCDAKNYGKETRSDYYVWEGSYDGFELVLRNVDNLTIRGSSRISTILETDPRWANVIRVQNSSGVTLDGFTAGHTRERGECSGGVLYLEGCQEVSLANLGLYGCGVVGLTTEQCSDITLTGSEIYECSSSAVSLHNTNNVTISGCSVYDIGLEEFGGYTFLEIADSQNVTVDSNLFSNSTLNHLLNASGIQVTLRNNRFSENRIRNSAFSVSGQNVILDSNQFNGNTIRAWYSGYGNMVCDIHGNELSEAYLSELYPAEPKTPNQPQLEIHVSTVDELIAAIGPNKDIVLEGTMYDFSKATGYGTSGGDYYYWEDVHDGPGLVIRNVDNMTIRSSTGNVKNHTLSAVPRYADVLAFTACSNVTLSGFTAGHTIEPGSCAGGVIEFRDCDNMTVDNCGLYGCGILGVYAEYSQNIHVTNCDIYECSQGGIRMRSTDNITINRNTFRDLGGEETNFIGCTNVNLDGQLLNPQTAADSNPVHIEAEEPIVIADEKDMQNLVDAFTGFANALFAGDKASMKLYLSSTYDPPIEIPEEIIGSTLNTELYLPKDYASDMEAKGYCQISAYYGAPNASLPERLTLEMCREQGAWKVQYYALGDTEIELLDKDLYNFTYAYLMQEVDQIEAFLAESHSGTVDVYFGDGSSTAINPDYSVGDTYSNAQLSKLDTYSAAFPFKKTKDSTTYTYLNIALQRRGARKTYTEGKYVRTESEWMVLDYGMEPTADTMDAISSDGIRIEYIDEETYNGVAMLIEDPARVFLGTSTQGDFSTNIPGMRIEEILEAYPGTMAAVNAGAFYDDGTASAAVGSYPLGLTISEGEVRKSPAMGIGPGLEGFAGFNAQNVLVVSDHNLTEEEAVQLDIRDGCGIGPALIINGEVQPAIYSNSGYAPRTAIGQKTDGTVILLCFNGRVFNSLGATYLDVANEMMHYGAVNACMMNGGSSTTMMYSPTGEEPQLLTSVYTMNGEAKLSSRRMPTYWMIAGE